MSSNYKRFELFWLIISIICLGTAGLYSIAVSMMRLPAIYEIFHLPDFFKISLVIHVTLSINVWFMVIGMYNMQIFLKKSYVTRILKYIVGLGIGLIIVSGFIPYSSAVIINYIPLIDNLYFIAGLGLFLGAFLAISCVTLIKLLKEKKEIFSNIQNHFLFSISFSTIIAYLCLVGSYLINKDYIRPGIKFNLEEFSWGAGHILQFTFVEIGFLCLIRNLGEYNHFLNLKELPKWFNWFLLLKIIVLVIAPFFYLSSNYYELFTMHMRDSIGLFLIPTLYLIIKNLPFVAWKKYQHYSMIGLILMIVMNVYGGVLGFSIREINVTVPAHYHGSLLAITITIMSFFYGAISDIAKKTNIVIFTTRIRKILFIQLISYGVGNIMHISGLMVMGGYGALRKTPGDIPLNVFFGKNLFMIGSLLSVAAGITFIVFGMYALQKIMNKKNSVY
jgi:hypothetical protein